MGSGQLGGQKKDFGDVLTVFGHLINKNDESLSENKQQLQLCPAAEELESHIVLRGLHLRDLVDPDRRRRCGRSTDNNHPDPPAGASLELGELKCAGCTRKGGDVGGLSGERKRDEPPPTPREPQTRRP